jgi:tRNA (guanine37-N1)-methyltransferase
VIPRFDVLTLHPAMVRAPLGSSILGRAARDGRIDVRVHDIRGWSTNKHRTVDDTPYGGGAGMVMRVDVCAAAVAAVRQPEARVLLTSPAGRPFTQADAMRLRAYPQLVLLCGHYEGIDARIEGVVDELVSLGDFVMTGGEIAAIAIVDAVARLAPGVLGNAQSSQDESFSAGLLEYPQYTRPPEWEGLAVPDVLLSGNHGRIAAWRAEEARRRTERLRPEVYAAWVAAQPPMVAPPRRRRRRPVKGVDTPVTTGSVAADGEEGEADGPAGVDARAPSR